VGAEEHSPELRVFHGLSDPADLGDDGVEGVQKGRGDDTRHSEGRVLPQAPDHGLGVGLHEVHVLDAVGVHVDEAGGDVEPFRVDRPLRLDPAAVLAYRRDFSIRDSHISRREEARLRDDLAVHDEDVFHKASPANLV
jgi:hypothetical protein